MAQESIINIKINTQQAQKSLDGTSKSVRDVDRNTRNLKKELKELKQEMQGLDVGSEKFQELAQEAGVLEDKIGKVNAATKAFASDTLVLDQTVGVVQGMAGAYSTVQGAMALAGVENERLMEIMVRLQAIQAVTNGIQSVGVMLNKASASGMLIRTTAQRVYNAVLGQTNVAQTANVATTTAQTTATGAATIATRGLAIAMNALPIMALVTGIGLIVSALFDWGDAADDVADDVADGMDTINEKEIRLKRITKEVNDLLDTRVKIEMENLRDSIRVKENELRLIDLKKEKTEEDLQNELRLKKEIIDINKQILETQDAYSKVDSKVDLSQALNQQRELQREMNYTNSELMDFVDNLKDVPGTLNQGFELLEKNVNKIKNASNEVSNSIEEEIKLRKKIANLRLSDFESQREFFEEISGLQRNLEFQAVKTEQKISELREFESNKFVQRFGINIDKIISSYEGYKENTIKLDEEILKNQLKNNELASKKNELTDKQILLDKQENLRKEGLLEQRRIAQRKQLLKELEEEEKRSSNAQTKIQKLTNERFLKGVEGQIEKLRQAYGKERDDLIENAIKRELQANEEKFLKLEISEEQYFINRAKIQESGIDNLLPIEQNYLNAFENYTDERIALIKKENAERERLTRAQTNVILGEQVKLSTKQSMLVAQRNAMLEAQEEVHQQKWYKKQLTEEEIFQKKMREVRSDFFIERMNDEKELLKQKVALLDIEKEQALDNEELTQVERTKIVEEYALKRQQLEEEASRTIYELNRELNEDLQNDTELGWLKTFAAIQLVGQQTMALGNEIARSFQIATQNAINSINVMYSTQAEEFNKQLVNQEISQEEHDDKMKILEKNKQAEIRALQMAQFQRDKKNNIAQALMSGAMAGAQAWVNPGFPLAFGILPLIAAQTTMAISNIRSQQFAANRGGIVPGDSTVNKDSVNAFLTPGEAVITKSSTDMFLPLLSTMNQIGGGKSLDGTQLQSQPTSNQKSETVIKTYVTTKDLRKGLDTDKRGRINSRF